MYLVDTNVCIHFLNGSSLVVKKQFQQHLPEEIVLCSIVKVKLLFGARKSRRVEANLQKLKMFFDPMGSLSFDDRCAEEARLIRADLAAQGKAIGPNDLLIASIAGAHDAALVTHNSNEFARVTGLKLTDWEIH